MKALFENQQIQNKIVNDLKKLKFELDRLAVRQSAVDRLKLDILAQKPSEDVDEEDDSTEDNLSHLDAIKYDLTTFTEQLKERLEHSEKGLQFIHMLRGEKNMIVFCQYVLEEIKLALRDAKVAREGYDELITNIKEITSLRDQ